MPKFTIRAYQEMFTDQLVEADSPAEAVAKFRAMFARGEVSLWEPSAEDLDIQSVRDENDEDRTDEADIYA